MKYLIILFSIPILLCGANNVFGEERYTKMPLKYIENSVGGMLLGESGFVVPWAISINPAGEMYLSKSSTIHAEKLGTICMKITRYVDSWEADIRACDFRWRRDAYKTHRGDSITLVTP